MTQDLRKEQLVLLRIEKQIAGLAATLAAGATAAVAADGILHATHASKAYADMQSALMTLAEVTGQAHELMNARAVEVGARMMEASGGIPKGRPAAVVASILGIG